MIEWFNQCPTWIFLPNYPRWGYFVAIYLIIVIVFLIKFTIEESEYPHGT